MRRLKAQKRPVLVATSIITVALLILVAGLPDPARAAANAAANASVAAVIGAAHFPEPLVRTAATTEAEDLALSRALMAYEQRSKPDDDSSITAFLSAYPHSGWAPALLTNLGLSYLHDGYFSRAIDAWREA